jgi:hypothetical protein
MKEVKKNIFVILMEQKNEYFYKIDVINSERKCFNVNSQYRFKKH